MGLFHRFFLGPASRRLAYIRTMPVSSAYIFGAICPARGIGAALVPPRCDTQAMQWHLDEISSQVAPRAHAVVICSATIRMELARQSG